MRRFHSHRVPGIEWQQAGEQGACRESDESG